MCSFPSITREKLIGKLELELELDRQCTFSNSNCFLLSLCRCLNGFRRLSLNDRTVLFVVILLDKQSQSDKTVFALRRSPFQIDLEALTLLDEENLLEMKIEIGPRKKILKADILFLKRDSSIFRQSSYHVCMWFMKEASQFSMGQTAQILTCSIMEKPHTGLMAV